MIADWQQEVQVHVSCHYLNHPSLPPHTCRHQPRPMGMLLRFFNGFGLLWMSVSVWHQHQYIIYLLQSWYFSWIVKICNCFFSRLCTMYRILEHFQILHFSLSKVFPGEDPLFAGEYFEPPSSFSPQQRKILVAPLSPSDNPSSLNRFPDLPFR